MSNILNGSTILVADDDPVACGLLEEMLDGSGAHLIIARSGSEAIDALATNEPDVAILDVRMPEPGGLAILQHLRNEGKDIPVLIVTGYSSSSVAIESTSYGAYDYLTKPLDSDVVLPALRQAIEQHRMKHHPKAILPDTHHHDPRDTIIGQSDAMQQVYKLIGRVANSNSTVLITGESGTGKELVARTLHQVSPRSDAPFIVVNCAALTETLLESELFGHEKGAFTGAMARRKGRFEQANTGTIFLDEIGEISPAMQKKLLRVLQEQSFERVGGNTTLKIDARVLAATNRDLLQEVQAGNFREDLYYRLQVINLHMPALRERSDDIALLVEHFLTRFQKQYQRPDVRMTAEALEQLMAYTWPGNVRQLENTIERAVVLSQDGLITPRALLLEQEQQHSLLDTAVMQLVQRGCTLEELLQITRHTALQTALKQHGGEREAAARALGIAASAFDEPNSPS